METIHPNAPTWKAKLAQTSERILTGVDNAGIKLGNAIAHGLDKVGLRKWAHLFESPQKPTSS